LVTTLGGEIYGDTQKLNEWFRTVPKNPVIIKFNIQSVFDLLTTERFPEDKKIKEKAAFITQVLE
ncbi:unnamed protein product, partial [Didymodactylos carnosus]